MKNYTKKKAVICKGRSETLNEVKSISYIRKSHSNVYGKSHASKEFPCPQELLDHLFQLRSL